MPNEIIKQAEQRMHKSLESLQHELSKLRTGRAHPSLLEQIRVESYGSEMPLNQVASVTVESARTLLVTAWDKSLIQAIEKAIISSDLGLNPATAGTVIRVPLPALNEESRKKLTKIVRDEAERARVAVRNIRRDANQEIKDLVKEKTISEDDEKRHNAEIQKITDRIIKEIDQIAEHKEADLMEI